MPRKINKTNIKKKNYDRILHDEFYPNSIEQFSRIAVQRRRIHLKDALLSTLSLGKTTSLSQEQSLINTIFGFVKPVGLNVKP